MRGAIQLKRAFQTSAMAMAFAVLGVAPAHAQTATSIATEEVVQPLYGNIDPFYRNIDPFWGDINPFYGNIDPFWGNIDPFYGNIDPFYGNINPFWGNIDPFNTSTQALAPAWGNIDPFWQDLGSYWKTTSTQWGSAGSFSTNPAGYQDLAGRLNEIVRRSELTWGPAVTSATGKSFQTGFANPLFAKFGIDLNNPATLANLTPEKRAQFFMEWYDGLMNYSGRDRFDHWMKTVNWTPAITQQQGGGADTLIGLIDSDVMRDPDIANNLIYNGGSTAYVGGHGIGVASLMVAAHDGKGVMGIAPTARVAMYNPYGSTGTAHWDQIRAGIVALKGMDASVMNMSLGVSGTTLSSSWRNVFSHSQIAPHNNSTIYVLAAGNDGITQTRDIEWQGAFGTSFLVVGSVDPANTISSFSNRPGNACLLANGQCGTSTSLDQSGLLMHRFLVAPGELMLVPNGSGGTTRMSGTSFAAPLVSGAIALLHDRWPWLAQHPRASQEIILRSARDLGAPGTDAVYGVGLLDVAASQAPLNFGALKFYQHRNGAITEMTGTQMKTSGVQSTWQADGVYFTVYENVGTTVRDFAIPMSSLLSGSVSTNLTSNEMFQRFVSQRLTDWINGTTGFTDVASYTTPGKAGWRMSVAGGNPVAYLQNRDGAVPHTAFKASDPSGRFAMTMGYGSGAMALAAQPGFGMTSDYASDGGINPLLGLASGGSFFGADYNPSPNTTISVGFTDKTMATKDNPALNEAGSSNLDGNDRYAAEALNLRVTHRASDRLSVSANYTRLREKNALLAVQALSGGLEGGSTSESATLGVSYEMPNGLTLAASASAGRTQTNDRDQALTTLGGGARTSAYAFSATKLGVLGGKDMLRLSVAQPMHIETGTMNFESVEVIDRQTGELGVVNHQFSLAGKQRRYTGELLYAAPVLDGTGEVSLFGRADLGNAEGEDLVVGAKFQVKF